MKLPPGDRMSSAENQRPAVIDIFMVFKYVSDATRYSTSPDAVS